MNSHIGIRFSQDFFMLSITEAAQNYHKRDDPISFQATPALHPKVDH
jgi:hypothetical protein